MKKSLLTILLAVCMVMLLVPAVLADGTDAATIGGTDYPTLQAAVNAAADMTGDVTIALKRDVTENVTVNEKVGLYLTIDGANGAAKYTMTGKFTVTLRNGSSMEVARGYEGVGVDMDETSSMTKGETSVFVAKIGGKYYSTVQAAIDAVEDGDTITILCDVVVTTPAHGQNALNHAKAVDFTLDLNDNTLSADTGNSVLRFNITGSGAASDVTLTIKNGTITSGDNTWCAVMAAGASADVKAIMNLEDLTIASSKAGDLAVKAWEYAVINARNVTVNATKCAVYFLRKGPCRCRGWRHHQAADRCQGRPAQQQRLCLSRCVFHRQEHHHRRRQPHLPHRHRKLEQIQRSAHRLFLHRRH